MNGYNFSQPVRAALGRAREEAVALAHEYVGTEHVLLGLVSPASPLVAQLLAARNVDPAQVRERVLSVVRRGRAPTGPTGPDLPYTSRAKHILELAMAEGRELESNSITTGHLFLGVLREEKGIGAQALLGLGFELDAVRHHFITLTVEGHNEEVGGTGTPAAVPGGAEMHPLAAVAALRAMARSPRVAAVLEHHRVDVPAIIRDLATLPPAS